MSLKINFNNKSISQIKTIIQTLGDKLTEAQNLLTKSEFVFIEDDLPF